MRMSQLFSQTSKEVVGRDICRNAQYLTRAGYVDKLMAGAYSYLPLGLRTLNKIENIIREEMQELGAQEILMPALQPKEIWEQTGRWDNFDVLFRLKGRGDKDLALGPTHEEVVTPLVTSFARSYRDLPISAFQIQTKFRDEPHAKSGLLRGREFRMMDMYSFHDSQEDLDRFYDRAVKGFENVFARCGLDEQTLVTYASGGCFSEFSHEFQTVTQFGEDVIYRVPGTKSAVNKEILHKDGVLQNVANGISVSQLEELKAIEVGNIFKLGSRFPNAFCKSYTDKDGASQNIYMGCYGIGSTRLMGTIAECLSDDKGLVWPEEVSPFEFHLVSLAKDEKEVRAADKVYAQLRAAGIEVLYDDRTSLRAGHKMADADLIGIPNRLVVSSRTLLQDGVEKKGRTEDVSDIFSVEEIIQISTEARNRRAERKTNLIDLGRK